MNVSSLEDYRNKLSSEEEKAAQLTKEICLFDSVHDFTTAPNARFYDILSQKRGQTNYSLLQTINFTIVCDIINPIKENPELYFLNQQNNAPYVTGIGKFLPLKSKSTTPTIEKYYLEQAATIRDINSIPINKDNIYEELCENLIEYAVSDPIDTSKLYIPLVIDTQKKIIKIMRQNLKGYLSKIGNIKLAYCLNREMTNDAAGKHNVLEKQNNNKSDVTSPDGIQYLLDVDENKITYDNNDFFIGGSISFSKLEYKDHANVHKHMCEVEFINTKKTLTKKYSSIINDMSNSKAHSRVDIDNCLTEYNDRLIQIQTSNHQLTTQPTIPFNKDQYSSIIEGILDIDEAIFNEFKNNIYFYYARKRFGDQLQAQSCVKINSNTARKYKIIGANDNDAEPEINISCAIFYSYDIIACAFAIIQGIPCIYEDSQLNIFLYKPKKIPNEYLKNLGGKSSLLKPLIIAAAAGTAGAAAYYKFASQNLNGGSYSINNPSILKKIIGGSARRSARIAAAASSKEPAAAAASSKEPDVKIQDIINSNPIILLQVIIRLPSLKLTSTKNPISRNNLIDYIKDIIIFLEPPATEHRLQTVPPPASSSATKTGNWSFLSIIFLICVCVCVLYFAGFKQESNYCIDSLIEYFRTMPKKNILMNATLGSMTSAISIVSTFTTNRYDYILEKHPVIAVSVFISILLGIINITQHKAKLLVSGVKKLPVATASEVATANTEMLDTKPFYNTFQFSYRDISDSDSENNYLRTILCSSTTLTDILERDYDEKNYIIKIDNAGGKTFNVIKEDGAYKIIIPEYLKTGNRGWSKEKDFGLKFDELQGIVNGLCDNDEKLQFLNIIYNQDELDEDELDKDELIKPFKGGSKELGDRKVSKKKMSVHILLDILKQKDKIIKNKNQDTNNNIKYLLLKILHLYEFKLLFNEELYEMYYNTTTNIAENKELYIFIEVLKYLPNINIVELLVDLIIIKNKNEFVFNLLNNLEEIIEFSLDIDNSNFLKLLETKHTKPQNKDSIKIIKACELIHEQLILKKEYSLFNTFYFNDTYFEYLDILNKNKKIKKESVNSKAVIKKKIQKYHKQFLSEGLEPNEAAIKALAKVKKEIGKSKMTKKSNLLIPIPESAIKFNTNHSIKAYGSTKQGSKKKQKPTKQGSKKKQKRAKQDSKKKKKRAKQDSKKK